MNQIDAILHTRKPAIYVMGDVCVGKSALINTIFMQAIVPQQPTLTTTRFIRLTYSPDPFVAHIRHSKCVKLYHEEKVRQEDVECNLRTPTNYRDHMETEIVVGVNHAILERGFDIVDTPLYNCYEMTNEYIMKKVEIERPLILYVNNGVDNCLTSDVEYLTLLNQLNLQMMYYTSKLAYGSTKTVDTAMRRARNVFARLVSYKFLSNTDTLLSCTSYFYCDTIAMQQSSHEKTDVDDLLLEQWERFMYTLYSVVL